VVASNLGAAIMGSPWDTIYSRMDEFNAMRDNRGAMVIDKETEDVKNVSTPLSTLDALQAQAQEQLCSVSRTPTVKLLRIQPTGLNASSDGEIRVYYDDISAMQEHIGSPILKTMLECIQLHIWGKVDPDISFTWKPLWQLDEAAEAVVRKTDADTAAVYIEAGVIDPSEERTRLASAKNGPWAGIDPDDLPEPPDMGEVQVEGGDPAKGLGETKSEERSGV
jgi:phage-related protein (TIGR01555 family)